ncbi:MAG: FAD-dependent oxidoreductase [Syntrophobacteraceae bacterium]
MEHVSCDILVIGSGAAGLRAAISARATGLDVCVLSKAAPGKSTCTGFSAGVLGGARGANPSDDHREQTLVSGRGINQRELVEILAEESPGRLDELVGWGIKAEFRNGFLFCKGRPPLLGEEIVRCLIRKNVEIGTRFLGNLTVAHLVMDNGAAGLIGRRGPQGEWVAFTAGAVVLATGGASALYLRHDNPRRMLGDGCRLALDAGAVLRDMEFVQFFPVCLAEPGHAPMVIPPRLADGGKLVNGQGENILEKYGIAERPAAARARDRLSQALFQEIYRDGRQVFLDLRGLTEEKWNVDPFSALMRPILEGRYGVKDRPLRVAPAAHHTMGGVRIDGGGASSVAGLFAAGEVCGGLHGANRLGGNALSETLVFGARAGEAAAAWAKAGCGRDPKAVLRRLHEAFFAGEGAGPAVPDLLKTLRGVMWEGAGIIRNRAGLTRALISVREIREVSESIPVSGSANPGLAIELRSAARVAGLIIEGALRRLESRGAHYREDFPNQNDEEWLGHLQVRAVPGREDEWRFAGLKDNNPG